MSLQGLHKSSDVETLSFDPQSLLQGKVLFSLENVWPVEQPKQVNVLLRKVQELQPTFPLVP
jgi:hypothetical protein